MRRFAALAITSGALVAGLATTVTPAVAAPAADQGQLGVAASTVTQGTLDGKAMLAKAKSEGDAFIAKDTKALQRPNVVCAWYQRVQGRKTSAHGRWLIYVQTRLDWCYDGSHVVSARVHDQAYTYNKRVWQWKGWAKRSLSHDGSWATVTDQAQGKFYYTGNHGTYKPWITVMGAYNGGWHAWWGG